MRSKKPLLVLIEDDAPLQKHLRALLAGAGYNVEIAEDGAKGLELARSHTPAIIILDLGLPDIDGQQLLPHDRLARGPASTREDLMSSVNTRLARP